MSIEKNSSAAGIVSGLIPLSGVIIIAAYAAAQILADVGSLKIGYLFQMSIDGGTFIYPITFTLRDMIHKKLGKKAARSIIFTCGAINLVMAGYFALIALIPADPTWELQEAFAAVLGPVWRIVAASIIAELVSELLDTEIYHFWVTKVTRRHQWSRVLVSNVVSIPVDSMIFCWIAFGGDMPIAVVWSIVIANIIVKGVVTLVSIPFIYMVKDEQGIR
ncbi:MAG: queuosine precursor transporter [Spirochaetaceae bacterium]|jgi:uncharacterized integral membrane protein (TIGR00697 family)|nr:queuosine precursor transporter [Spirochaetaceae bacterium]